MSKWDKVGGWIKDNAGSGAALIGSLLTGNIPAAIAAGAALVSGATGTDSPDAALSVLQSDPAAIAKLRELYYQNEASVRVHLADIMRLELDDEQAQHAQTQRTIRAGDRSEYWLNRATRPLQSWLFAAATIAYVFSSDQIDMTVLGLMMTYPLTYAGLRQYGKTVEQKHVQIK